MIRMKENPMFNLEYGLYIITAKDEKDNGCIVNALMQVTDNPNRVVVAINKNNLTHEMIVNTGKFNISVLSEKSQFNTYKHWGLQSGRDADKLEGIVYSRAENGVIYITEETNAYMLTKVVNSVDLGTHTLFIAEVTDAKSLSDENSVTYSYYQKNIKPAPLSKEQKKGYICTVCGYIYEGEVLPDDYICPLCNHSADYFQEYNK